MMADQAKVRAEFIEKVGLIAQGENLPRIAGRVLGLLIFDGQAVSFGSLADELQVSRGSISTSTRTLIDRGLIKRVTKPGERQDYFQLGERPYATMMRNARLSFDRSKAEVEATVAQLSDGAARDRVRAYAEFYSALSDLAQDSAERLDRD